MLANSKQLKEKLEAEMQKSSRVFIVGHNSPDFDSIGSAIGVYVFAQSLGKPAYIVLEDDESKFESGVKRIIDSSKQQFHYIKKDDFLKMVDQDSLLVVTDVNKAPCIVVGDSLDQVGNVVVIDHHLMDETTIPTEDMYISLESSSACEIVAKILSLSKVPFDKGVANYLLAGICLDTRRFKHNTTDKTHDVAEKLIKKGADIDFVNNLFLEEFESFCRISNLIINGTTIKKISESVLNPIQVSFTLNRNQPEQIYRKEDYAKAADRMMKFYGIDAAFALGFIEPGIVHISARSGKRVNVGKIMSSMGGGGHFQSAGGRIATHDIFQVENELMQKVLLGLSDDEDILPEPPVIKVKQVKKS